MHKLFRVRVDVLVLHVISLPCDGSVLLQGGEVLPEEEQEGGQCAWVSAQQAGSGPPLEQGAGVDQGSQVKAPRTLAISSQNAHTFSLTEVGFAPRQEKSLYDECRAQLEDALGILTADSQSPCHFAQWANIYVPKVRSWLFVNCF